MSSAASNYDMRGLVGGQIIAGLGLAMAVYSVTPVLFSNFRKIIPFLVITLAYGIMMFASSYVEEEQHFWYWASSAWLAAISAER
jgi:ethanolaminephosphotransferase